MKKVEEITVNDIDSLEFELQKEAEQENKKSHYVNNKELYKEFVVYHKHKMELKEQHIDQVLSDYGLLDVSQIETLSNDMQNEVNKSIDSFTPPPLASEKIGKAILDIAYRRCYSPRFVNYAPNWKEEMISDAIEACVRYGHNFNPDKYNNPFAYLTQLVTNALFQRIKKEHTQQYIKYKLFDDSHGFVGEIDENNVNSEDMELLNETNDMYNDRLQYIDNFETMNKMNKARKKKSKSNDNNLLDLD
ncbi:MAG: hypothetical protein R3230_00685 [Nitrosopumilaceae archaeon]|nr:hypothetical protein [Nitrosopumilaceae archaeon]